METGHAKYNKQHRVVYLHGCKSIYVPFTEFFHLCSSIDVSRWKLRTREDESNQPAPSHCSETANKCPETLTSQKDLSQVHENKKYTCFESYFLFLLVCWRQMNWLSLDCPCISYVGIFLTATHVLRLWFGTQQSCRRETPDPLSIEDVCRQKHIQVKKNLRLKTILQRFNCFFKFLLFTLDHWLWSLKISPPKNLFIRNMSSVLSTSQWLTYIIFTFKLTYQHFTWQNAIYLFISNCYPSIIPLVLFI